MGTPRLGRIDGRCRMRILHIAATGVHGYLDLNVKFFPDVTFLFGLNGSGKTTVLRLVSALLAPKLEEL